MMMILGYFVFSLATAAYQTAEKQRNWRQVSSARVGEREACQYLGPGDETLTLTGLIVPEFGSRASLEFLNAMADTGQAYSLLDGTGHMRGKFVIESLTENHSFFTSYGLAQRIEFTLTLKRVDDLTPTASWDIRNLPSKLRSLIPKSPKT